MKITAHQPFTDNWCLMIWENLLCINIEIYDSSASNSKEKTETGAQSSKTCV